MDLLVLSSGIAYLLATIAIVSRLFHPNGPNTKVYLSLAFLAIVTHIVYKALSFVVYTDHESFNISLPNLISLLSLFMSIVVTIFSLRFKLNLLLPVIYGFSGIWQLLLLLILPEEVIPLATGDVVLITHISLALIAYCILLIATLFAFQVNYINFKLKTKNLNAVANLPPLMQVEKQLFSILIVGTLVLLTSLVTGFIFLDNFIAKENAHKTVLSLSALFLYVLIIWGHYKEGWRGHKVLVISVTASVLLTLSYFGSRFVKEFLLS
ncbi:MAG: cytochrome C assembly family protein [Colwellia sp.]